MACCHIFVPLHLEMHVFPVDESCDNLTECLRNHTGAMSGAGQETGRFVTFRNVHEVDTAILAFNTRICIAKEGNAHCLHCVSILPVSVQRTFCRNSEAHTSCVQEVPCSTHTFLILPLDAASCLLTMAGTKSAREGCYLGGGSVLYLVSLSSAAESSESQLGRVNARSNFRRERPRSRSFPPGDDHVSGEAEGERCCIVLLSPPAPPPPPPDSAPSPHY